MARINYRYASLSQTSLEVMVYYHARTLLLGLSEQERTPHSEVMNACIDGPLEGALYSIEEWDRKWARIVDPDLDLTKRPEIGLSLNVTSKGNLEVLWKPIMTQEQYDASPYEFKSWMNRLDDRTFGQQRQSCLYFIRDYQTLIYQVNMDKQGYTSNETVELSRIATLALALMMKELPRKLASMVNAYWQDIIDFDFSNKNFGNTPTPGNIKIYDMWEYSKNKAHERLSWHFKNIGSNADDFSAKWDQISIKNPKIKSDSGRSKILAKAFGVTIRQIDEIRSAIAEVQKWNEEKPHLWWNRQNPYSIL